MLRRIPRAVLWFAALSIAATMIVLFSLQRSPSYQICTNSNTYQRGEHGPKGPQNSDAVPNYLDCATAAIDANRDLVIALSAFFTAVFTGTLWLATIGLWQAGEKQIRASQTAANAAMKSAVVAERTLNDIERPYIFAEITGGELPDPNTFAPAIVTFMLSNYGRTPAILKRSCDQVLIAPSLPPEPTYSTIREGEMIIGAGDSKPFERTITFARASDIHQIQRGEVVLFLFGYVIYEDVFDRIHTRGFCFRFGSNLKSFNIAGGDAYNYSKTEKKNAGPSEPG